MALQNYVDQVGPAVSAAWLNNVDKAINGSSTGQGAALVPYQPPGTGAVATTVATKLAQTVSVIDFGADPTGAADSTTAIRNAVATGKAVRFNQGSYTISGTITISTQGQSIFGDGIALSQLYSNSNAVPIFSVTANSVEISNLNISYNTTAIVGGDAIYSNASDLFLTNIQILNGYNGIQLITPGNDAVLSGLYVYNTVNSGIFLNAVGGTVISNFIINAITSTNNANGGLFFSNQCEGAQISNGDILGGSYSITTGSTTYAPASRPAYIAFSNVYFDSSVNGTYLNNIVETSFTNCWFSGGRSGSGNPGCSTYQCNSIGFVNCKFVNCGSYGAEVNSTSDRVRFVGCSFNGNSFSTASSFAGLLINTATNTIVIGNTFSNTEGFVGTQGYGISISNSTTNAIIKDNVLSGNATGPIFLGAGTSGLIFEGNIGYVTQNGGLASAGSGTSLVVNHGLSVSPNKVLITPVIANYGAFYVSSVGATSFTINWANSGSSNWYWKAEL